MRKSVYMPTNKEIYQQLCAHKQLPLMSSHAWMDAVSIDKDWDVLLLWRDASLEHSYTNIAAAMPYHVLHRWGVSLVLMPQLTMAHSIYLSSEVAIEPTLRQLADEFDRLCQREHYRCCYIRGNWPLAFREQLQELGFSLESRTTYQIEPLLNMDDIVRRFSMNKRRQLRCAQGLKRVEMDMDNFYSFHKECLAQRGQHISYSHRLLQSVVDAVGANQRVQFLGAQDEHGQILAAIGLVCDDTTCFYLLPCYWKPASKSGAMAWLTAQAILLAGERGLTFDFEGGNEGGLARSYHELGGHATTYYSAEKYYNPLIKLLLHIHDQLK